MIQTRGFAYSKIDSLTDEINKWMMSNTQGMDTKFRLIDIKYASSAEVFPTIVMSTIRRLSYMK